MFNVQLLDTIGNSFTDGELLADAAYRRSFISFMLPLSLSSHHYSLDQTIIPGTTKTVADLYNMTVALIAKDTIYNTKTRLNGTYQIDNGGIYMGNICYSSMIANYCAMGGASQALTIDTTNGAKNAASIQWFLSQSPPQVPPAPKGSPVIYIDITNESGSSNRVNQDLNH
jgi:hypothetical protein